MWRLGPSAADQETQRERNERRRKRRAELEAEREAFRAKTAHVIARLRAENLYRMQETSVLAVNTADDTNPAEDQPQAVPQNTPQKLQRNDDGSERRPPCRASGLPGKASPAASGNSDKFPSGGDRSQLRVYLWYMLTRASDQYVSHLAFSIRTEDAGSALDLLGGLTRVTSNGGTSDTDLLFDYLQSPALVKEINDETGPAADLAQQRAGPDIPFLGPSDAGGADSLLEPDGQTVLQQFQPYPAGAHARLRPAGCAGDQ